ncbi:MAG: 16S rRNA (cytosine(967)-C(5))-methyltransferase RsmB [Mogibacterium sp.]|nr:16S rRNA (cytosine(967)-C(5))-methyltransferase RsmB [Mogibacterium sp.]
MSSADWITSFEALKSVYTDGAYSNMALNEAIPRHPGCRDSFVRNMVKGTVRQTVTLDYIIGRLASNGLKGIKPRTLIILRMGLFAIRGMDSVPDHAAVNEAVSLARKTARGTDRFINAVLRSYLRRRDEFENQDSGQDAGKAAESVDASGAAGPADRIQNLSVKYAMPADLTGLICEQYGEDAESVLKGLNEPPEMVLRVNTLKNTRENLIDALRQEEISAEAAPASVRAVIAKGSHIIGSDLYRNGMFTVQSLSSIMSIEAFSPAPGSKVLDMCAAPGGKSTMMAEIMGNQGSITACDIHEHRLELIKASAARTGAEIIETKLADGTVHESALDGTFDYVLADVPCSGLGVMSTKPEIRLRTDVSQFAELTDIQLEILKNAFRYTKPGGRICYSTCTLNRDENEGVVGRFMAYLAEISGQDAEKAAPRASCEVSHEINGFARIVEMKTLLPYNNLIGFYYCIIDKNAQAF